MSDWKTIRDALNIHQELRFAGRDRAGEYMALQTCRTHLHGMPLLDDLEQQFTMSNGPKVVALVGGPGSGKSYTAWMLYNRLIYREKYNLQPFYLPMAYFSFESEGFENNANNSDSPYEDIYQFDLHMAAQFIYQQVFEAGLRFSPGEHPEPEKPNLFIMDDASLANPEAVITYLVNEHISIENNKDDRILLLLQDNHILHSLHIGSHQLPVIHLQGFDKTVTKYDGLEDNDRLLAYFRRESWPMMQDSMFFYEKKKLRFNSGLVDFYDELANVALSGLGVFGETVMKKIKEQIIDQDNLLCFAILSDYIDEQGRELIKPAPTPASGSYPHRYIFTFSETMGLVPANSSIYAHLLARRILDQVFKTLEDKRPLPVMISELPKNRVLADMVCAAFLNDFAEMVTYKRANQTRGKGWDLLDEADSAIAIFRKKGFFRSLMQMGTTILNMRKVLSAPINMAGRDINQNNRSVSTGSGYINDHDHNVTPPEDSPKT